MLSPPGPTLTHVAVTTTVCALLSHLGSFGQFDFIYEPMDFRHCAIYGLPFSTEQCNNEGVSLRVLISVCFGKFRNDADFMMRSASS